MRRLLLESLLLEYKPVHIPKLNPLSSPIKPGTPPMRLFRQKMAQGTQQAYKTASKGNLEGLQNAKNRVKKSATRSANLAHPSYQPDPEMRDSGNIRTSAAVQSGGQMVSGGIQNPDKLKKKAQQLQSLRGQGPRLRGPNA